MLSSKLFTTWREAWSKPAEMVALFEEAEALLVRRGKGNQRFPIAPAGVFEGALDAAEKYDGRGTSKPTFCAASYRGRVYGREGVAEVL